ncbi:dUTP diphosphatase [Paenibacillus lactis]|uniref:dUTP diphosphatase n=1 Tax=Paenibacillus lactis TaxID=228574 RepID=UPI00203CCB29|nr:dUTP diphosphatase [Paenibacillus lactis]MCM3492875.1 dUTP diphosphatase [Paenibacillus lactis]
MNLTKLFEMQRELDERIVKEKGLEGKDLLPQKILALQVELGECANEWRGFKFWSKDQQPRYEKKSIAFADPGGPFEHVSYPLLEEYIDCLHFILSIGIHYGYDGSISKGWEFVLSRTTPTTFITSRFIELMDYTCDLQSHHDFYADFLWCFLDLGYMLGFNWQQISDAYMDKNKTNHERQSTGY